MNDRMDPVYRATFRHAETTDTRQGIRRDEPQDDPRRRRPHDDDRERPDPWQDITTVSIPALRAFLLGLLNDGLPLATAADDGMTAPAGPAVPPARAPDPVAARAAGAYQATARTTHHAPPSAPPPAAAPQGSGTGSKLSPDERRAIRTLITDLDRLAAHGVEELVIEKSGTFLDSLRAATAKALGPPPG